MNQRRRDDIRIHKKRVAAFYLRILVPVVAFAVLSLVAIQGTLLEVLESQLAMHMFLEHDLFF